MCCCYDEYIQNYFIMSEHEYREGKNCFSSALPPVPVMHKIRNETISYYILVVVIILIFIIDINITTTTITTNIITVNNSHHHDDRPQHHQNHTYLQHHHHRRHQHLHHHHHHYPTTAEDPKHVIHRLHTYIIFLVFVFRSLPYYPVNLLFINFLLLDNKHID